MMNAGRMNLSVSAWLNNRYRLFPLLLFIPIIPLYPLSLFTHLLLEDFLDRKVLQK